jgi:hypothetical protein
MNTEDQILSADLDILRITHHGIINAVGFYMFAITPEEGEAIKETIT